MIRKLAGRYEKLYFCYEAGPTGYGLYRQVRALGHDCIVVAPSLVPTRPGERVKTNRRVRHPNRRQITGAQLSSQCHGIVVHEAVRDLVRARRAASEDLRRKRQQLLSFLLRHGRIYSGRKHWTKMHLHWLAQQKFGHPAQQIVFQHAVDAIEDAATRLRRLDQQVAEIVPSWSMAPVVEAYQAMRGVSFGVAVTFVAEIGDLRRFDNPRQLMAFRLLATGTESSNPAPSSKESIANLTPDNGTGTETTLFLSSGHGEHFYSPTVVPWTYPVVSASLSERQPEQNQEAVEKAVVLE